MRETELARVAQEAFFAAGAQEVPFAIVGTGPNSAFPHHATSSRAAQAGEPVLADLGSRLDGYMSDITRMAFLGTPTARYREIHAVVEEAVAAALETIRPGVPMRAVDLAARGVIARAGYGDKFTHRTGHGIGVSGHELPSITHTNEQPLEVGMAFSVEPGIYLVGEFGVRLEEIVVVTARGPEVLSPLPRTVWAI
jgi:Xaa-Pro aminopeptidase